MSVKMEISEFYRPSTKDQDTMYIKEINGYKVFIVLDGHGFNSKKYVELIKFKFNEKLVTFNFESNIKEQLKQMFINIDRECNISNYKSSGTTCSLVMITKDKMYVASVGDSDVYLFKNDHTLIKLNPDHNGLCRKEMERLKSYPTTQIVYDSNKFLGQKPVWTNDKFNEMDATIHYYKNRMGEPAVYIKNVSSMLGMTRSIGDYHLKKAGIICIPEVNEFDIPSTGDQLLIASDGFWDCWSQEELIQELADLEKRKLVHKTSQMLNKYYFSNETCDDNSLIHIEFI